MTMCVCVCVCVCVCAYTLLKERERERERERAFSMMLNQALRTAFDISFLVILLKRGSSK